jgi:hypothetical protein
LWGEKGGHAGVLPTADPKEAVMDRPAAKTTRHIDRFFQEIVLCLGGVFASHECDEALIRQVTASMETIYRRHRKLAAPARAGTGRARTRRRQLHPASRFSFAASAPLPSTWRTKNA